MRVGGLIHNKLVSEQIRSTAAYTNEDRLEKIEAQLEKTHDSIRETITAEVAAAVKGTVAAMQQVLVNRFVSSIDEISKQQDERLTAAIGRLEGRVTRSRDTQEALIKTVRDDQLKFQNDIRSTLTTLQGDKSMQHKKVLGQHEEGFVFGEGSSTGERRGFGGVGSGYGGGSGSGGGPGPVVNGKNQWRHKKLDMPLFDGSNPDG